MRRTSVLRFGATSAFLCAALYVLVGFTHFLLPRDQLRSATGVDAAFFHSLGASSAVFVIHYWIVVLACLFSIGVIMGFFLLLREHQSGLLCWAVVLGLFGTALTATDYTLVGVGGPRLAQRFAASPPAAQAALVLRGVPHVDPCFFGWGLIGMSMLIANAVALRAGCLPRVLASLGILEGVFLLSTFAGALGGVPLLVDISIGLGGALLAPVWNSWFGWTLRRVVDRESGPRKPMAPPQPPSPSAQE